MKESIVSQIVAMKELPTADLQKKYEELFNGEKPSSNNKTYLWRQIAYRIQEMQNGGLSEEARAKIEELIKEYDPINNTALKKALELKDGFDNHPKVRDSRLPIPGTIITKEYKSATLQVKVLEKGFEYDGKYFKSLTGLTRAITGQHWSGYNFFSL